MRIESWSARKLQDYGIARQLQCMPELYLRVRRDDVRRAGLAYQRPLQPKTLRPVDHEDRTPKVIAEIYDLCRRHDTEGALDLILDTFDELAVVGNFTRCDELLRSVDVAQLDVPSTLGFLSATHVIAKQLPGRAVFFRAAYERIARDRAADAEQLLSPFR